MNRIDLLEYSSWSDGQKDSIQPIIQKLGEDKFTIYNLFEESKEQADRYKEFLNSIDANKLHDNNPTLHKIFIKDTEKLQYLTRQRIFRDDHQRLRDYEQTMKGNGYLKVA